MNMKTMLVGALVALVCVAPVRGEDAPNGVDLGPEAKIAAVDAFGGFRRTQFDFGGARAWLVEPAKPRGDGAWVWCMKWAGCFPETTGQYECLKQGYYFVTYECGFAMTDELLPKFRAFQAWLVKTLPLQKKANLLGMSWGGFYSVRYASTYPDQVRAIYLDNPLLDLDSLEGIANDIGAWAKAKSVAKWADDPRMPVNRAVPIAQAKIPVLLMYGDSDQICPPDMNCIPFAARFKAAGGALLTVCRKGADHHPHGGDAKVVASIMDFFAQPEKAVKATCPAP